MRILIKTNPIGPLSVLSELPDARLAVLEGLNGIGKTLAVRLLQICTGVMPYRAESPSWTSLCRDLGEFRIHISGLRGGQTIEWEADSRNWLGRDDVGTHHFNRISINERESTLEDVRRLLIVHRLAGDETLIETLAQQADDAESIIRRWMRNMSSSTDSPLARLEYVADSALRMLGEWTIERYTGLLHTLEVAQNGAKKAGYAAEANVNKRRKLEEALELQRRAEAFRRSSPELRLRIQEVDDEIVSTRREIDETQARIVYLAEHTAKMQPVLRELKNAQRTLERNQEKLSEALNLVAAAAADLGLDPTREASEAAFHGIGKQIEDLNSRQLAMDVAPALRDLLGKASSNFMEAEVRGLGEQVALEDPETAVQLTVRQTRIGIATRHAQLQGQPPPPAAREVAEQLADAEDKLRRVSQLVQNLDLVDRYRRLVALNEERVDKALLAAADPSALAELQQLEGRRRELDGVVLDLAAERAVLRQQLGRLGSETLEVVESRLHAIIKELNIVEESQLPTATDTARRLEEDAQKTLVEAEQQVAILQRDALRAEAEVRRTVRSLTAPAELGWIQDAFGPTQIPAESAALRQQVAAIDRVRTRMQAVIERLGAHRTQLAAVSAALRGIGRHLRGQDPEATEYVPQLEEWFGSRFSDWFNSDKLRAELLPDADDRISVDVHEREVRWLAKGHERSRPLEAFSSGEQAFAYTRARLAVLDQEVAKAPNRLIVLDEFGAFIAHDRLSGLLSYLQTYVATHPEDQALVILPLSRDYASEAKSSIGLQKEDFQRLAKQVESQRFGVRVLEK